MRRLRKLRHLRTPLGRQHLLRGAMKYLWRPASWAAWCYRRTLGRRTRVIAVVGSFGKTTTAAAIQTVLGMAPQAPHQFFRGPTYTGLALSLIRTPPWRRWAAFEVAIDGPGQMAPYARMLRPDIVVVTSIGSEHHRSLGTLEGTRDEKGQMLAALRPGGLALLNRDDPLVMTMAPPGGARIVTFGLDPAAEIRAGDLRLDWPGTRFTLHAAGECHELSVRLLGRVMAYPILAAVAVAIAEGLPLQPALATLAEMEPRPGRLQALPLPGGAWLIRDDFKSSLETIDAALDVLAEAPGRRIAVLGSISEPRGSQGPLYRRLGGRLAAMEARLIVVGSAYSRYAAGARAAGMSPAAMTHAASGVRGAWEAVQSDLRPGDVVLVKGRDNERLDRVGLALQGRTVRCTIEFCDLRGFRCAGCPMLGLDRGAY